MDKLNSEMVEFTKKRYEALGEKDSGLYGYYVRRLEHNQLLKDEDRYILNYLNKTYPKTAKIHEMASGATQLGHALSLLGFSINASECDKRRALFAEEMGDYLGSNCEILTTSFYDLDPSNYDLFVTVNAVGSLIDFKRDLLFFKTVLERGCNLIIQPNLWGSSDVGREELFGGSSPLGLKAECLLLQHNFIHLVSAKSRLSTF
jgi:hypothetical protein